MDDRAEPINGTEDHGQQERPQSKSRAERDAGDRASILAGWDEEVPPLPEQAANARKAVERKPLATPPGRKRVEVSDEKVADVELDATEDDAVDDEIDLDDDHDAAEHHEAASPKDHDTDRRLGQVRAAEKRAREKVERERTSFEREREQFLSEWRPKIEAYEKLEKAKGSGDAIAMAESFGYGEDDFEELSKIFHGYSKAAASDPKWKDYARNLQRDRATRRELAETRAELKKLSTDLSREREERSQVEQRDQYLGRIAKSAGDSTPLLQKDLDARGPATREALRRIALAMAERDNETPEPKAVAAAYERRRRAALERDKGLYDFLKTPTGAPTKAKTSARASIQVDDRTSTTTPAAEPAKRRSVIPSRDEFLRKMLDDKELEAD